MNGAADTLLKSKFVTAFRVVEQWQSGLRARAHDYLMSGVDRPVLMELETQRKMQRQKPDYSDSKHQMHLTDAWFARRVLYGTMGGQPECLARLAEIQHAIEGPINLHNHFSGKTVYKAPETVSQLLTEVEQLCRPSERIFARAQTAVEDILAAVEILGGRASDVLIFDLCRRSSGRLTLENGKLVGDVALLDMAVDDITHALRAMDAATRTSALKVLGGHERSQDPALLSYLMGELGATSAKLREQARLIISKHPAESIESSVIELLSSGKSSVRTEAAILAGEIGSTSCKAAPSERLTLEKTASTLAIVEQYVDHGPKEQREQVPSGESYLAADGHWVRIPEYVSLLEDTMPALDSEDEKALAQSREAANEEAQEKYQARLSDEKSAGSITRTYRKPELVEKERDRVFGWISTGIDKHDAVNNQEAGYQHLVRGYIGSWLAPRLNKLPLKRQVQIAVYSTPNLHAILYDYRAPVIEKVVERMEAGEYDLRHVLEEASLLKMQLSEGSHENSAPTPYPFETHIETLLEEGGMGFDLPDKAVWPLLVEHIPMLVDALPPMTGSAERSGAALRLLGQFPKLPASALQSVVFCAISDHADLREEAQWLLTDIDEVDTQLIAALEDKRQTVRCNAVRFLVDRCCAKAVKPIQQQLKKEKSENVRAEMISALVQLGADVSPYLGRKALLAEAEKLTVKLPGAKLDWLPLAQRPTLHWKDGETLPDRVITAWLKLALKFKQPGGSQLFRLYLEQLQPDDVTAFADWLLASWIAYDTDRGDVAAMRVRARKDAERVKAGVNFTVLTVEQLTEQNLRDMLSVYPYSGNDSKGILALTHRATPAMVVPQIQSYLKNHGKRVSQAKALVEVLAASGTPEALQVLVAITTRFKQRSVRELAEQLLAEIAAERGWSEDELADRTVPSGGFEKSGTLVLEIGETGKCYTARLGEDLSVKLFSPEGKAVKALPAGKDETTKESKALLSAARKSVKTVAAQQAARLYVAMVAERHWPVEDWRSDICAHPILRRLTERVIWLGFNEEKEIVASFRPTAEGDFSSADGDDVALEPVTYVGIAHTAHVDEETRQAWLKHISDFEIKVLFSQIERPIQVLSEAQCSETVLDDRMGWVMDSFTLRSVTGNAGFERGQIGESGGFDTYIKPFRSAGITAVLNFSGSYVPEDNIPAAIIDLHFVKGDGAYGKKIKLGEVPAILLSECWADLHQIAEGGAYDSEWKKKGLY